MDIGSAFTFVFDDEDWIKKLAIGGGITLVGAILTPIIIGLALLLPIGGYMLETIKNVRDGQSTPLPEWTDIGGLFSKGLMVFVIFLVYNIPSILLSCASFGISLAAPNLDSDVAQALSFVSICIGCLQFIVGLVAYALIPAALIRYAQFDSLGSAFQFGEIFSFISANMGDYVIAVLLSWVASLVAIFGVILCVVGVFFTLFWSNLVTANLIGQLARKAATPA
ncbi:MAG TPA: DUF4013 domain-containing protein [Anaerolineae bacterium]